MVIHVPVRFDTYGTCGANRVTADTRRLNSSRIGSIIAGSERVAGRQPAALEAGPLQRRLDVIDGLQLTGEHAGLGAVRGGQRHPRAGVQERVGLRQRHGQHRAGGQRLHQGPARGDRGERILLGEHAREARRRVLADAVTSMPAGRRPHRIHSRASACSDDEERRLHDQARVAPDARPPSPAGRRGNSSARTSQPARVCSRSLTPSTSSRNATSCS